LLHLGTKHCVTLQSKYYGLKKCWHIKRKYNLLIGLQTAELIKITVGNSYPMGEPEFIEMKGRDLVAGIPKILTIDS